MRHTPFLILLVLVGACAPSLQLPEWPDASSEIPTDAFPKNEESTRTPDATPPDARAFNEELNPVPDTPRLNTDTSPTTPDVPTGTDALNEETIRCPNYPQWAVSGAGCVCTPGVRGADCSSQDSDCDRMADPLTRCGTSCVDTRTDSSNCGGCGRVCQTGQGCQSGSCVCATPTHTSCTLGCVDLTSNLLRCRFCAYRCQGAGTRDSCCPFACEATRNCTG